jgi:hypothetical protein
MLDGVKIASGTIRLCLRYEERHVFLSILNAPVFFHNDKNLVDCGGRRR